eukprot:1501457-Lingulodinium_polyedra.AAC.1
MPRQRQPLAVRINDNGDYPRNHEHLLELLADATRQLRWARPAPITDLLHQSLRRHARAPAEA